MINRVCIYPELYPDSSAASDTTDVQNAARSKDVYRMWIDPEDYGTVTRGSYTKHIR
jgi:hypothetical protein